MAVEITELERLIPQYAVKHVFLQHAELQIYTLFFFDSKPIINFFLTHFIWIIFLKYRPLNLFMKKLLHNETSMYHNTPI